jgi:hypothetical protein
MSSPVSNQVGRRDAWDPLMGESRPEWYEHRRGDARGDDAADVDAVGPVGGARPATVGVSDRWDDPRGKRRPAARGGVVLPGVLRSRGDSDATDLDDRRSPARDDRAGFGGECVRRGSARHGVPSDPPPLPRGGLAAAAAVPDLPSAARRAQRRFRYLVEAIDRRPPRSRPWTGQGPVRRGGHAPRRGDGDADQRDLRGLGVSGGIVEGWSASSPIPRSPRSSPTRCWFPRSSTRRGRRSCSSPSRWWSTSAPGRLSCCHDPATANGP